MTTPTVATMAHAGSSPHAPDVPAECEVRTCHACHATIYVATDSDVARMPRVQCDPCSDFRYL